MKKIFLTFFCTDNFLSSSISFASEQLIESSGSYVMDSRLNETPASTVSRAREEAKRADVEKAGVYLQSYSKTVNSQLATDEIQTIAARLYSRDYDKVNDSKRVK